MSKPHYQFTILGCGSSPGVPRPNGDWGNCDYNDAKNKRYRASLLVERRMENGQKTTVVIDTGPDFRSQMIMAKVQHLDAAVFTHSHADHTHGIDDLRSYVLSQEQLMDVYADQETLKRLYEGFGYCFKTPKASKYPPILNAHTIKPYNNFKISGKGGAIDFKPLLQHHGGIDSIAFRIGNTAYCTDVSAFPDETPQHLLGLDVLIIDALQYKPHPSHFSLEQALKWIEKLAPKRAILTHMHVFLDYQHVLKQTPNNVEPGYDGLSFESC